MYTQFFGNFLLDQGVVTKEQLFNAMQRQSSEHMKLGTLAIHAGLMTAAEVEAVKIEQTHRDQKFGEIAVDMGYLTSDQVVQLLRSQSPDFLLLGQILVDDDVISDIELERLIQDYRQQNEMIDLDMTIDNHAAIERLLTKFYVTSETPPSRYGIMYVELLFNNFVRFVGEDFTVQNCMEVTEYPVEYCVFQEIFGDYEITSYLNMDEATAIAFASRYAGEDFMEYNEYIQASMEDFLNLHNGLFIVNTSNEASIELTIGVPQMVDEPVVEFEGNSYVFPILYSFGTVNFILEVKKTVE